MASLGMVSAGAQAAGGAASIANSAMNMGIIDTTNAAHLGVMWTANMGTEDIGVAQKAGEGLGKI